MSVANWQVIIPNNIVSWIANQNDDVFDRYVDAVDVVRELADLLSYHTIVVCGHGFLIFVETQDVALRCAFFEDRRQIHITEIVS